MPVDSNRSSQMPVFILHYTNDIYLLHNTNIFTMLCYSTSLPDVRPSDDLILTDDIPNNYSAATLQEFSKLVIALQNANDLMETVHFHVMTNSNANSTNSIDVSDEDMNDLERGWV